MDQHEAALDGSMAGLGDLAERCLREPASRSLDAEIYCAVHKIVDMNDLSNDNLLQARAKGEVLVEHHRGIGWVEAPPFTAVPKYAETLLPDGLASICRDPRRLCATALVARALTAAPAPRISSVFEFCLG